MSSSRRGGRLGALVDEASHRFVAAGRIGTGLAALAVVALALGIAAVRSPMMALVAAIAVLTVGIVSANSAAIVALTLPSVLLMARVGPLSLADLFLGVTMALALVFCRPPGMGAIAPLVWGGTVYLATAVPTIVLNPYSANLVEWLHEVVLVIGSLVVGYAIGRGGHATWAMGVYVVACCGIGVWASAVGVVMLATQGAFGPVYLPTLHKNFIGNVLGMAMIALYARVSWFRWPALAQWSAMAVLACGIAAAGSRQAMIGTLAGFVVLSLRPRLDTGRRPKIIWIAAAPVLLFVSTMVSDQLDSGNRFNSAYERLDWYAISLDIWSTSPVFGVGHRWWYTDRFDAQFQPPNAEFEVLSATGIVGLIGFFVMIGVGLWTMWRVNPAYGSLGLAVIAARFTQTQFDLYWVAGQSSFLWIVAAMCIGVRELDRSRGQEVFLPARPRAHFTVDTPISELFRSQRLRGRR